MLRIVVLMGWLCLSIGTVGCGPSGKACSKPLDCPSGEACHKQTWTCVKGCAKASDCGSDEACGFMWPANPGALGACVYKPPVTRN